MMSRPPPVAAEYETIEAFIDRQKNWSFPNVDVLLISVAGNSVNRRSLRWTIENSIGKIRMSQSISSKRPPRLIRVVSSGIENASSLPLRYSVKYVCGSASCGKTEAAAAGEYFTAINVHNPSDEHIRFRKKVVVALPGKPGLVSEYSFNSLGPHEALEIDCAEIFDHLGLPGGCFVTGFVVIDSMLELDIVAVYTGSGADKQVESIDVEYIQPRSRPSQPRRPDLVPVPPFPPANPDSPAELPQNFCFSTVGSLVRADAIRVIVRNQGQGDAGASITEVAFHGNPLLQVETPPLPAGGEFVFEAMIPEGCFQGESPCNFKITADATSLVAESNESNNSVDSFCPGVVS